MSLRINQNVLSVQTYGNVVKTSGRLEKSVEKLSSGLRINRAADDAAGLAISEKMRRQVRGLNRAVLNAQDGISMIQTAEGALNETHSILQRMRELAIQSSNDTLTSNDRLEIQKEVLQLRDDLDRISRNTEFNTKKLLDGSQTALISSNSSYVDAVVAGNASGSSGDYDVSIALLSAGISQMQRSQIFTVKGGDSELAKGSTQLQSIAQFYDENGVFILDSPMTLSVNGNTKTASIQLDAQMTLDNVAANLQNVINSASGLGISNSKVATVNTATSGIAGLGGYFEITSGDIGETGDMSFAGDQKVIDALGLTTTRESANNRVELTMRDNYGNVRQVRTETNRATGLLNGVDVAFESQAAQIAGVSGLEQGLHFSASDDIRVQVGSHSVVLTIASGNFTMQGLARSFNHQIISAIQGASPQLDGLSAQVVEGEIRFSYDQPASAAASIGNTITIASAGNNILGFLDGSYSGFVDGKKDVSKSQWGFTTYRKDVNVGDNVEFLIGDGIATVGITLFQSSSSAGGSVTAADMVEFNQFQATVNYQLAQASVMVRVDQIGGTMAFTATRVGNEKLNNQTITSLISVNIDTALGEPLLLVPALWPSSE